MKTVRGATERPLHSTVLSAQYCLDKAAECDRKALEARDPRNQDF